MPCLCLQKHDLVAVAIAGRTDIRAYGFDMRPGSAAPSASDAPYTLTADGDKLYEYDPMRWLTCMAISADANGSAGSGRVHESGG